MGKLTISMAIFNSYVSLPEGTCDALVASLDKSFFRHCRHGFKKPRHEKKMMGTSQGRVFQGKLVIKREILEKRSSFARPSDF